MSDFLSACTDLLCRGNSAMTATVAVKKQSTCSDNQAFAQSRSANSASKPSVLSSVLLSLGFSLVSQSLGKQASDRYSAVFSHGAQDGSIVR